MFWIWIIWQLVLLSWRNSDFELYAAFDPLAEKVSTMFTLNSTSINEVQSPKLHLISSYEFIRKPLLLFCVTLICCVCSRRNPLPSSVMCCLVEIGRMCLWWKRWVTHVQSSAIFVCNRICQWIRDVECEIFLLGATPFNWWVPCNTNGLVNSYGICFTDIYLRMHGTTWFFCKILPGLGPVAGFTHQPYEYSQWLQLSTAFCEIGVWMSLCSTRSWCWA